MVETRVFESDLLGRHLVTIEQLCRSTSLGRTRSHGVGTLAGCISLAWRWS